MRLAPGVKSGVAMQERFGVEPIKFEGAGEDN